MKKLCLLFMVLSYSGQAYAHGDHTHAEADELLKAYRELVHLFQSRLEMQNSNFVPSTPNIRVGFGNARASFNQSAMNEIMQIAVEGAALSEEPHCHGCFEKTPWYVKTMKFLARIPTSGPSAMLNVAAHPIVNSVSLAKTLEAFVRRNMRSYDPSLFLVIVVSQAAWESLETVITTLLGVPGLHVACTVFNAALLGATLPFERFIKLATNGGTGMGILERLRLAQKTMFWQMRFILFGGGADVIFRDTNLTVYRRNMEVDEHDVMATAVADGGFFASILYSETDLEKEEMELRAATVDLHSDLDRIFDPERSTGERMYIAQMHAKGFGVLVKLLTQIEGSLRTTSLPRAVYLPITELAGRMHHILTNYSANIMLLAASSMGEEQTALHKRYQFFMEHFIATFHEIGKAAELAYEQGNSGIPEVDTSGLAERLKALESEAKKLNARMQILRGKNHKKCDYVFSGEWEAAF